MRPCRNCWRRSWRRELDDDDWDFWNGGSARRGCHAANSRRHRSDPALCCGGLPGDAVAELGLVDPGVVQALIAPVIVVELTTETNGPRRRIELLAGQEAMAQQVSQRNVASAEMLFETALGLLYCGEMFHIEGFIAERFGGVAYLYRVAAVS